MSRSRSITLAVLALLCTAAALAPAPTRAQSFDVLIRNGAAT